MKNAVTVTIEIEVPDEGTLWEVRQVLKGLRLALAATLDRLPQGGWKGRVVRTRLACAEH